MVRTPARLGQARRSRRRCTSSRGVIILVIMGSFILANVVFVSIVGNLLMPSETADYGLLLMPNATTADRGRAVEALDRCGTPEQQTSQIRYLNDPTMPPRNSSADSFGFVHIGKTAGSTISHLLRNGCNSFETGPCRNITDETIVSKLVEHYYHVPDFFRLPTTNHKAYIVTARDPFDRTVSAFLYHHPENSKFYNVRQTRKQLEYGPLAYQCFKTLETFAALMKGSSAECDYPYRHNMVVATNCEALACAVLHGKVRFFTHLFFNFRNILDTKVPCTPPRTIYVLRQENLWDDWVALNLLLGQKESVIIPHHTNERNITGIQLPVGRDISLEGRQKLCTALELEYKAYFRLVRRAANMDENDLEKCRQIAQKNCPNLDTLSMARSFLL